MKRLGFAALAVFAGFAIGATAAADCGVERWPVKTGTDADAALVNSNAALPASIEYLRSLAGPRPLPQSGRVAPTELTVYDVTATLVEFKAEDDGDYHLVIADSAGRTMIAELPAVNCVGGSVFASMISGARSAFASRFSPTSSLQRVSLPIEVRGVGFFDFLHGQTGVAPNGIELHPVLSVSFSPFFTPAPPLSVRRRAVGGGGSPSCDVPALTIATSKSSACSGEPILLTWQASDPHASVSIDGVGTSLPSSGSTTAGAAVSVAYSGRATNSCGTGFEAVAEVTVQDSATASLFGPGSLQQGGSATLTFSISGASSWTLSSSLRNSISPSSGSSSSATLTSTYTATSSGTDMVTLVASGGPCGSASRAITIAISSPPPPPPPPNLGLLCCDGTRSPSCFNCSSKQGCCSSHKGVCGCQ
jgi:hypothetical protein